MEVAAVVERCGRRNQGLVTRQQLLAAGLSPGAVSRAVAAGHVVRVHRRVYALAGLDPRPRFLVTELGPAPAYVAHVRAAVLAAGPGAVVHRRTAAALYGWPMLVEPARTVEIAVPHGSRRGGLTGVAVAERRGVRAVPVVPVAGAPLPLTSAAQTVIDCCLELPLLQAVVVCDSALRSGHVRLAELVGASRRLAGVKDARRVRRVLELCDPHSGSVLESVLRTRMVLRGIEGFQTQQVIASAGGRHVLRADFTFAGAGLVVEVDGQRWHDDARRDQRTDNMLAVLGWRVLRFSWTEVVHDPDAVLATIESALSRTSDCHLKVAAPPLAA